MARWKAGTGIEKLQVSRVLARVCDIFQIIGCVCVCVSHGCCVNVGACYRSDFAVKGGDMTVNSEVERVIKDFHAAKKPIGLCCIAPVLAARVLGGSGVTLTLGQTGVYCFSYYSFIALSTSFIVHRRNFKSPLFSISL